MNRMIDIREYLIKKIRSYEQHFRVYVVSLNKEEVKDALPKLSPHVLNITKHYPKPSSSFLTFNGGPQDALHERNFAVSLLEYYERFLKDLNKEVKVEKHDHHGLHGVLEKLVFYCKKLVERL